MSTIPFAVGSTDSLYLNGMISEQQTHRSAIHDAKVMVIDDESTNVKVLSRLLQLEGYTNLISMTDSLRAMSVIYSERPDIVLLDLMMPDVSGVEILTSMRSDEELRYIPVVILTAATDYDTRLDVLRRGATDFLNKPLEPAELSARITNVLSVKYYQDRLKNLSSELETEVRKRTSQLEDSKSNLVKCLARAAEFRDDDTGQHIVRVGKYARLIGAGLGMTGDQQKVLEQAAQLHDVGKLGIPDRVLLKPGRLTDEEFDLMRRHCGHGKHILQRDWSQEDERIVREHAKIGSQILELGGTPVLDMAARIALTHHEWWNGAGYPLGLQGEDIPLEGRITAVADVFDALTTKRCYKDAYSFDKSCEIMESERGTHFEPRLLDIFFQSRKQVVEIQMNQADES